MQGAMIRNQQVTGSNPVGGFQTCSLSNPGAFEAPTNLEAPCVSRWPSLLRAELVEARLWRRLSWLGIVGVWARDQLHFCEGPEPLGLLVRTFLLEDNSGAIHLARGVRALLSIARTLQIRAARRADLEHIDLVIPAGYPSERRRPCLGCKSTEWSGYTRAPGYCPECSKVDACEHCGEDPCSCPSLVFDVETMIDGPPPDDPGPRLDVGGVGHA